MLLTSLGFDHEENFLQVSGKHTVRFCGGTDSGAPDMAGQSRRRRDLRFHELTLHHLPAGAFSYVAPGAAVPRI